MLHRVVTLKLTDVSDVRTAAIIRTMNKPCTKGQQYIYEPSKLGLTNGEWVTIGEEAGQWQTGGRTIAEAGRTSQTSVNFNVTTRTL
jgi:hypothetical protein